MAVKRGKSQARRNNGNNAGLPGWAWLVLGIVLTIVVVLAAPKFLASDGDGFFRPQANPDARPAASDDEDAVVPEDAADAPVAAASDDKPKETEFDFYTLLPGEEVAMSDAELAASERAEEERRLALEKQQQQAQADAADATPPSPTDATASATPTTAATPATVPDTKPAATVASADNDSRYILQAGAFAASGDAETLKAKIALLGLGARVESAQINGKTMYRVRMGPYGTASELAEAKRKLGSGGLPAMAIRAK